MGLHIHYHRRTQDFVKGDALPNDAKVSTVYAGHLVGEMTTQALRRWAILQGFLLKAEPHVTTAASRKPVNLAKVPKLSGGMVVHPGGRSIAQFGDHVVMLLTSDELQRRHAEYKQAGASWDFPTYQPHITLYRIPPGSPAKANLNFPVFDEPITLGPEERAGFDDY